MTTRRCAHCNMELQSPKPADLVDEPPKLDDIMICGGCGCPNKVTLLGTAEMTEEELSHLTEEEERDIRFAIRAVKKHLRLN